MDKQSVLQITDILSSVTKEQICFISLLKYNIQIQNICLQSTVQFTINKSSDDFLQTKISFFKFFKVFPQISFLPP